MLEQARLDKMTNNLHRHNQANEQAVDIVHNLSMKRVCPDSGNEDRKVKSTKTSHLNFQLQQHSKANNGENGESCYQCLTINIPHETGRKVYLSGKRDLIRNTFPEISETVMGSNKTATWNQSSEYVSRFPLNEYCKLNSLQTIERLLGKGFNVVASNGVGVEGQLFSEYLLVRKASS